MIRLDNVNFQYQQGFIEDDYFETATKGIRQFVPIWKALGMEGEYPGPSRALFESLDQRDGV